MASAAQFIESVQEDRFEHVANVAAPSSSRRGLGRAGVGHSGWLDQHKLPPGASPLFPPPAICDARIVISMASVETSNVAPSRFASANVSAGSDGSVASAAPRKLQTFSSVAFAGNRRVRFCRNGKAHVSTKPFHDRTKNTRCEAISTRRSTGSTDHCLVYYERGGSDPTWLVTLFHWTPAETRFEWGGHARGGLGTIDQVRSAVLSGTVKGPVTVW
jgi:hypothetical protein